ncbi:MAG: CbiX/SirB N-terminal domain-containing protein [Candidatus Margulisiibacteriota bacterium]
MHKRLNKACKFFPCHAGLEDCTFCYCPFYPCLDEKKGGFIFSTRRKKDIWSCKSCNWIHKIKIVEDAFALMRKNKLRIRSSKNSKAGIILLGHGSRLKKANADLNKTVLAVRKKTGMDAIVPAYLQLCQPDLEKSIKDLIANGHRTVIIVPFFLFNGNHVTRDIPHIIAKEKEKYPKVNFLYTKNLGEDTRISDIVSDITEEATQNGNTF